MKKSRILYLLLFLFVFANADGQGWLKKLGNKVVDKVEKKAEKKTDQAIDKELDNGQKATNKSNGNNKGTKDVSTESSEKGKLESFTQYDFVPGDKIIFFEDFSQDLIGDFPAQWTGNSTGEVKKLNIAPGNWLHMNGKDAVYCYTKKIAFPDNFIFEFDFVPDKDYSRGTMLNIYEDDPARPQEINDDAWPGLHGLKIIIAENEWETIGYKSGSENLTGSSNTNPVIAEKVNHVIIWVQKRRVRIYHQGAKVLDIPTNIHSTTKFNKIVFNGWDRNSHPYITNLKVTTASPDTRSKLLTEGKVISYGIYFDSGKDIVKPESYGSIREIANVLNENPTVRIKVTGHTDSDGDDALNLDLSKRRAANVKQYLIDEFKIDGSRIETDGKGESAPIADNNSAENKAKNRRVEFTKL
ncbi:OmpA family protein [uncultured Bacteroides sp.]|uniref:OmpA family protein n=1 Tax=uncultured Bacteroides sp. TaxID=162156 RepID=UPI002AABAE57|nr:OmpA family protein [uncultured Bacteroides sp.]